MEETLKQIEQSIVDLVKNVNLATLTDVELAELFAQIDTLGAGTVSSLEAEYQKVISDIANKAQSKNLAFSAVTESYISQIVEYDAAAILGRASEYSNLVKSRMLKGIIGGESVTQIAEGLNTIGLATSQTIAAVNTAEAQIKQLVTKGLYEGETEQRFILTGPLDGKTRDSCRSVLKGQPSEGWTVDEIESGKAAEVAGESYTYVERGGYNCRHDWQAI